MKILTNLLIKKIQGCLPFSVNPRKQVVDLQPWPNPLEVGGGALEPPSPSLSPLLPPVLILLCPRQIKEEDLHNKKGREGNFTSWGDRSWKILQVFSLLTLDLGRHMVRYIKIEKNYPQEGTWARFTMKRDLTKKHMFTKIFFQEQEQIDEIPCNSLTENLQGNDKGMIVAIPDLLLCLAEHEEVCGNEIRACSWSRVTRI